jgi:hypothetical protein
VTPIGQQNPPGPLKLLGLREKTGKNTDFDFAQITTTESMTIECGFLWWRSRNLRQCGFYMAEARNSIGELILLISPGFGMTGYEDEREYSDRLQSGSISFPNSWGDILFPNSVLTSPA